MGHYQYRVLGAAVLPPGQYEASLVSVHLEGSETVIVLEIEDEVFKPMQPASLEITHEDQPKEVDP